MRHLLLALLFCTSSLWAAEPERAAAMFREQELLDAVNAALTRDAARRARDRQSAHVRACFDTLTPREREVMAKVSAGWLNKQIADQQGENERLLERNRILEAEVLELKQGMETVEERARQELGMVKEGETLYQLIE